jgi:hypothetical protein
MGNFVFPVAKGAVNAYHDRVVNNDPATSALIIVLLAGTVESDATLKAYTTLAALLANNSEATATNYARKTLTDAVLTVSSVSGGNRAADIPDQTWTALGGTVDNTLAKLLVCYDADTGSGTDASIVPLTCQDFVKATNGSDIVATVDPVGYFRAS